MSLSNIHLFQLDYCSVLYAKSTHTHFLRKSYLRKNQPCRHINHNRQQCHLLFSFRCSKHAKRHPNFNANALRQRRLTLSNFVDNSTSVVGVGGIPLDGSTTSGSGSGSASIPNVGHVGVKPVKVTSGATPRLNKADSVNSSEDTPSEEPQYSDKMSDSLPSP